MVRDMNTEYRLIGAITLAVWSPACAGPQSQGTSSDSGYIDQRDAVGGDAGSHDLADPADAAATSDVDFGSAEQQGVDPAAARRGEGLLTTNGVALSAAWIPKLAIENLWLVWGYTAPPPQTDYWRTFRARYGLVAAPFDNGQYPLGLRANGDSVGFDCLLCHADRVAGKTILGVGNSRLDLQRLYADLVTLADLAPKFGYSITKPPPLPIKTLAAGTHDAMGLGMTLAAKAGAGGASIHTDLGGQQAPSWWTVRFRSRLYVDGSGAKGGTRLMMATLLASGASYRDLEAKEPLFRDVYQAILAMNPPRWSATTLNPTTRARGKRVYDSACASCHGSNSATGGGYPNRVVSFLDIGTDPIRAQHFDANDATYINASWFGADAPMHATQGYLAPPLRGVWATAPYFHNGSVPDLAAVLDSTSRPLRWKRLETESDDYDPIRLGVRHEVVVDAAADTAEGRRVVDTTRAGLSNRGHLYGDALTAAEREDLLEYLRGL
jgi:mono/diheme cytochrome c family protein